MNPLDPQRPPPVDSSVESLNGYFARQGYRPDDNPLTTPAMFVRNPRPPRPPAPGRRRLTTLAIRVGAVIAVLACCAGLNAVFNNDDDKDARRGTAEASTPSPTYSYSPPPTPSAPSTTRSAAAPSPTANPLDSVDKGDCLTNTGTDADPEMVPAACGPGTYQVLRRIFGTIDASQCQNVSGATTTYTVTYYLNYVPQISRSYVFCLKKR